MMDAATACPQSAEGRRTKGTFTKIGGLNSGIRSVAGGV